MVLHCMALYPKYKVLTVSVMWSLTLFIVTITAVRLLPGEPETDGPEREGGILPGKIRGDPRRHDRCAMVRTQIRRIDFGIAQFLL